LVTKDLARVSCAKLVVISHPFRRYTGRQRTTIANTINFPWGITVLDGINGRIELSWCFPWGFTTKLHDGGGPHVKGLIYFGSRVLSFNEVVMCKVEFKPRRKWCPRANRRLILRYHWWCRRCMARKVSPLCIARQSCFILVAILMDNRRKLTCQPRV
jgi:hypothetical protein